MDLGLKGRRVLVTGGSQGIGLAVARGKERLAQAVAELRVVAVNPDGVETERMEAIQRARAEKEFGDASRWREYVAEKPEHLVGANVSSVAPSSHSSRCDARRAKSHASLLIASV
jgi:nucleoside-diphosphate-sugar epimerase